MKRIASLRADSLPLTPSSRSNTLLSPAGSLSPGGVLPFLDCVTLLLTHFRRSNHWSRSGRLGMVSSGCRRSLGEEFSISLCPPKRLTSARVVIFFSKYIAEGRFQVVNDSNAYNSSVQYARTHKLTKKFAGTISIWKLFTIPPSLIPYVIGYLSHLFSFL